MDEWFILLLMAEGHQPLDTLLALPVGVLRQWGAALQGYVSARNKLVSPT